MAIYKLNDIVNINRGSSPRPINNWLCNGDNLNELPWAKISDIDNHCIETTKQFVKKEWLSKGMIGQYNDLFLTNSATPGIPFFQKYNGSVGYHDGFLKITPDENIVYKKYLFYKLIIDRPKLLKMGNGSIFINLSVDILKNWKMSIPNLDEQQDIIDIIEQNKELFLKFHEIIRIDSKSNCMSDFKNLIDIIEPIETFAELVKKIINKMDSLFRSYSKNGRRTNFNLNELVNFVKGKTVKSTDFKKNGTPFIDVRYLNSAKISKYVDKSPNITYDDILLSLDGSTGIVKTGYSGYNGYVYKVSSTKINNFEIYLNLINDFNQSIISANSVGTTIKHASTAKKIMEYFDYTKYSSSYLLVVKRYFEKLLNTIMQIINKCVTMLIK
jgi:restriction endonuclease S subunit